MNKGCAFCCYEGTLTGEHLWSAWISKLLAGKTRGYDFSHKNSSGRLQEWQQPTLDQKTKIVCAPCNNGWMSDLETETASLLSNVIRDDAALSLLPRGVTTLAAFAFKNVVVGSFMANECAFFSSVVRQHFRERREVPKGVQMWLAGFKGKRIYGGRWSAYFVKPSEGAFYGQIEFYVFTYAAGRLAFQLVAARWTDVRRAGAKPPELVPAEFWEPAVTQFWPQDGFPVSWPPSKYFEDEGLNAFKDRFATTPATIQLNAPPKSLHQIPERFEVLNRADLTSNPYFHSESARELGPKFRAAGG